MSQMYPVKIALVKIQTTFSIRILFLIKYSLLFKQEANLLVQMFLLSDGMCSHAPAIVS